MFGHLDVGELAGQWKDILELKGRQLRHKRLGKRSVQYDGHSVELVTFSESDQVVYRDVDSDSDDTGSKRGRKGRTARDRDHDGDKSAKKTAAAGSSAASTARRKKAESASTNSGLIVRLQVVKPEEGEEEEEEEYSFQSIISTNTTPAPRKRGRKANSATAATSTAMMDNEFVVKRGSRRVKKAHYDVYFDLTSEIQKVNYETAIQRNPLRAQGEWYCCVCFGDEDSPENPYVCCKRCGCVVHRYCYGVETVPSNPADWLCDYCASVEMNQLPWKGDQLVGYMRNWN